MPRFKFNYILAILKREENGIVTVKMVKILSTGEIVSDDDPRAQQNTARSRQVGSRED